MIAPGRILVTGGTGRWGRALGRLGCHAVGRDRLDITDASNITAMIEQTAPTLVINTAAYTDVDGAEAETELAHRINAHGAGRWRGSALWRAFRSYMFQPIWFSAKGTPTNLSMKPLGVTRLGSWREQARRRKAGSRGRRAPLYCASQLAFFRMRATALFQRF
ncbi:MAG: hypothetical protein COA64_01270 [Henriciella sp.]|nr:MAG: hypothetical protein COA64_01270 [Henriciella sp.]